jgi:20S proteasome alpha/beta subunit
MSCIVGISKGGVVYIGSDSVASSDGEIRLRGDPKLIRNGNFLFGYSGCIRSGQVLSQKYWKAPKDIDSFVDSLRTQLETHGCMEQNEAGRDLANLNIIIGFNGFLYEVQSDFQLAEYGNNNYTAIGAGSDFALGSLFETEKANIDPVDRVQRAIEAAIFFSPAVGGKVLILQNP